MTPKYRSGSGARPSSRLSIAARIAASGVLTSCPMLVSKCRRAVLSRARSASASANVSTIVSRARAVLPTSSLRSMPVRTDRSPAATSSAIWPSRRISLASGLVSCEPTATAMPDDSTSSTMKSLKSCVETNMAFDAADEVAAPRMSEHSATARAAPATLARVDTQRATSGVTTRATRAGAARMASSWRRSPDGGERRSSASATDNATHTASEMTSRRLTARTDTRRPTRWRPIEDDLSRPRSWCARVEHAR